MYSRLPSTSSDGNDDDQRKVQDGDDDDLDDWFACRKYKYKIYKI